ncbi:phospholipase [Bradyrhizobium sp. U87765 SZCCT0131]|uniref:carboxylesterase family protein n=1 Tax=unclassified Bradyrhizobium TaxID=2631580 RepID=UPI001BA75B63|nr:MULTISPECIES: phospholipase [unclassified Bradyrhizobium]MBR1217439.1 phospholipase [Bradyrhizobium sp. U87765 SZCCT0131]MBR1264964.1 phospholipase [Bradyrhizobium sp. U87765 SZCCT0134]MBR1304946.1 phospholipase [Bradyrhizobium sp. U87765 SZCCT0110]MBR1320732.1 phospholipase [Bradyrhizobium sp. U87765 SZCCT0109]MBR1349152.1 phospholipase [Bradyrhizobium sp. U87765 SZCCT0048]
MDKARLDDLVALLPPLLRSLDGLGLVARHFHPPDFGAVLEAVGTPEAALREALPRLAAWPADMAVVATQLRVAGEAVLAAFAGLRAAPGETDSLRMVFRALRQLPRAQEALYPLTDLAPIHDFFIDPQLREDAALQARFAQAGKRDDTGVMHAENGFRDRGGFSLYVPEYYTPDRAWPLVMALHGGSGHGRAFLWSWLRDARSRGAILVTPTAVGPTWALMGEDPDTPNLARILAFVRARWAVDPQRLLLTGLSDGGTFSYVSGLEPASPFTHLAPVAASFHPLMAQAADAERLHGLPIRITHGALDWMFPVEIARGARQALTAAGANVSYREIEDLSHTYPREENAGLLDWLAAPLPTVGA